MTRPYSTWGPAVVRKGTKRKFLKSCPLLFPSSRYGQCDPPETYIPRQESNICFWCGSTRRAVSVTPSDRVIPGIEDRIGSKQRHHLYFYSKDARFDSGFGHQIPRLSLPCFSSVSLGKWWDITSIKPQRLLLKSFSIYYSTAAVPFDAVSPAYVERCKINEGKIRIAVGKEDPQFIARCILHIFKALVLAEAKVSFC